MNTLLIQDDKIITVNSKNTFPYQEKGKDYEFSVRCGIVKLEGIFKRVYINGDVYEINIINANIDILIIESKITTLVIQSSVIKKFNYDNDRLSYVVFLSSKINKNIDKLFTNAEEIITDKNVQNKIKLTHLQLISNNYNELVCENCPRLSQLTCKKMIITDDFLSNIQHVKNLKMINCKHKYHIESISNINNVDARITLDKHINGLKFSN